MQSSAVRFTYGVSGSQVHIISPGRAVERVERMHGLHLTRVCVHSPGSLTRLDVSPNHGSHVPLVVHETSVEIGRLVWVWRDDVSRAT
jgi:hypothetical protein